MTEYNKCFFCEQSYSCESPFISNHDNYKICDSCDILLPIDINIIDNT